MASTSTAWSNTTIPQVLAGGLLNSETFTLAGTVYQGEIVKAEATTTHSYTVVEGSVACNTAVIAGADIPIGVAMESGVSGDKIAVALTGTVVYVREGDGVATTCGALLTCGLNTTVLGCVSLALSTASGWAVGQSLDVIAANSTGRMIVNPQFVSKAAS